MTGQFSSIDGLRPRTAASNAADRRNTALRSAILDLPLTAAFGPILLRLGTISAIISGPVRTPNSLDASAQQVSSRYLECPKNSEGGIANTFELTGSTGDVEEIPVTVMIGLNK